MIIQFVLSTEKDSISNFFLGLHTYDAYYSSENTNI